MDNLAIVTVSAALPLMFAMATAIQKFPIHVSLIKTLRKGKRNKILGRSSMFADA
jgi:small neutral amino acid transporter SnatA (MarC family)